MEINVNLLKDNVRNVLRITTRNQIYFGRVVSYNSYTDDPFLVKDISIVNDQIPLLARIQTRDIMYLEVKEEVKNYE